MSSCKNRLAAGVLVAASVFCGNQTVRADTVEARLTTLFAGRQDPRDGEVHTVVPFYELLWVRASEVSVPGFSDFNIVVSGWGRLDPGEPADERSATGDLDIAYAEGALRKGRIRLRLGRQLVATGVGRNLHFDGLNGRVRVWKGLALQAYLGNPTSPRLVIDRGDLVAGTRVSWKHSPDMEVGVSFLHLVDDDLTVRQEVGLDGRVRPHEKLTVVAAALLSTLENRLAEAEIGVEYMPKPGWYVNLHARRTAPDLFIARSSIFWVFTDQERDEIGGRVSLRLRPRIRVAADVQLVSIPDGLGHRGGGDVVLTLAKQTASSLGVQVRRFTVPDNGYSSLRVYARHSPMPKLRLTLDAAVQRLDQPMNTKRLSITTTATAGLRIGTRWDVVAAGIAGTSPLLSSRFEVIAKVVYRIGATKENQ